MLHERFGFTLVELLVVIAVISVLAAMLLPALEEARRNANRIVCVNTVRNWGQIFIQYAGDCDGVLTARTGIYPNMMGTVWADLVEPYGGGEHLAFCSESPIPESKRDAWWTAWGGGTTSYTYYGQFVQNPAAAPRPPKRISDAEDQYGGWSLLMGDVNRYSGTLTARHTNHADYNEAIISSNTGLGYSLRVALPTGVSNCWIDGHVTWTRPDRWDTNKYYTCGDRSYHWE